MIEITIDISKATEKEIDDLYALYKKPIEKLSKEMVILMKDKDKISVLDVIESTEVEIRKTNFAFYSGE